MSYTQADLDALRRSIAKGVRKAKMGEEELEFRSLAEMERLERRIEKALGQRSGRRVAVIRTRSGWRD